jgi:hypothetical protein
MKPLPIEFSMNSTKTQNTSERRPESARGLYVGYGKDGWRMQKKSGTDKYDRFDNSCESSD